MPEIHVFRPAAGKVQIECGDYERASVENALRRSPLAPKSKINISDYGTSRNGLPIIYVSRSRFVDVVIALVGSYGLIHVTRHDKYSSRIMCTLSCAEAIGDECECSCGGENHGTDVVGDVIPWTDLGAFVLHENASYGERSGLFHIDNLNMNNLDRGKLKFN